MAPLTSVGIGRAREGKRDGRSVRRVGRLLLTHASNRRRNSCASQGALALGQPSLLERRVDVEDRRVVKTRDLACAAAVGTSGNERRQRPEDEEKESSCRREMGRRQWIAQAGARVEGCDAGTTENTRPAQQETVGSARPPPRASERTNVPPSPRVAGRTGGVRERSAPSTCSVSMRCQQARPRRGQWRAVWGCSPDERASTARCRLSVRLTASVSV
ncbi:hypothetical protein BJY59DRAFT_603617 [Rhodotorula toruloides]